ncbi:Phox-associated domain protein [Beauveria brongniartii RCEF 3172]|uniref:Phox-associated domain protein n=1 Tax=Beauveria brongniartii RCEF 3172 TaxID=1081107 RepID=A0A162JYV7_9HYPO|nr:Phox-associated domain protein [Beauveria brongniartii RCEF 3172]
MALKRRDVIIASIVAFIAWGYVVSWFGALRWAGYAFGGGLLVGLFALLGALILFARNPDDRRPRPRAALFLAPQRWRDEVAALRKRQAYERPSLDLPSQRVAMAVDNLLDLVLRDFVRVWYTNISPNSEFPDEVDRAIRLAIISLLDCLRDKDIVELSISRVVPILTAHFRDFYEAERSIRGKKLNKSVTESDELDLAIAAKYNKGKLHPAASLSFPDMKIVQQDYLRGLIARVLPKVMPRHMLSSRAVSIIVKEIVSCAVLSPVMQLLSEPDTWNQIMENMGRSMLQDRSTVRKLRAALDQHASPAPRVVKTTATPRISSGDSERKFEKFIRAIRKVSNLSDARRFRNEVASQLKRDSLEENPDQVYLRRLEMGKRLLDQRVAHLAAGGDRSGHTSAPTAQRMIKSTSTSRLENAGLVELLRDSSGLSYFMEFMDRQKMMTLVQFWLVVDGIRNPLEDDGPDNEALPSNLPMWTNSDWLDVRQIQQAYMSKSELNVPEPSQTNVKEFLQAGKAATPAQYFRARRSILQVQSMALETMKNQYFQAFKKSDLYYKCLASQETSSITQSAPMALSASEMGTPHQVNGRSNGRTSKPKSLARLNLIARRVGSSTDLASNGGESDAMDPLAATRRSLDEDASNPIYYDDEIEHDNMADSNPNLEQDDSQQHKPDTQAVQAVEKALNNIMENERPQTAADLRASLFTTDETIGGSSSGGLFGDDEDSSRGSIDVGRPTAGGGEKPSLSSLGLVSAASRIGVFVDDDLFADEDKHLSDERDDVNDDDIDDEDEVHAAAPGDLGLAEAITVLTNDIDRLIAQEAILDSLTRKAELTNNTAELRILSKSKASLDREVRRKELQRQQYVVQESDNSLYGRSTVNIKSIQVGREDDGREFALYVIEVQRDAGEQMPAASWVVARRYSEFHDLHQKLRSRYPSVRHLDFPGRRVVMKFQSEFLRKRRVALEKFLQELLLLPDVCRSRELRAFLSESAITQGENLLDREDRKDIVSRLYDSVTDGMEDILGNIPVLDQISVAGQNLITAATNQLNSGPLHADQESFPAAEAEAELNAFESKELEPFIKPICDIFLEVFELNRGNNWLRGRAVVVVLQQLLGGTIERKVRDTFKMLAQEEPLLRYIGLVRDNMWPQGQLARDKKPRSAAEKRKTRTEASLMLATLVPDLAGSVVGRVNAQAASRRLFATFNNSRLKQVHGH